MLRIVFFVLLCFVSVADAQSSVQLEFRDGRVWLVAHDAPVRAILGEWARRGGATIVNIDRVNDAKVTLELTGVTERDALDSVLRGTAGYMIASRPVSVDGASAFDRIVILSATRTLAPSSPESIPPRAGMPRQPFGQATAVTREREADQEEDTDDLSDPLARLLRDGPPRVDAPVPVQNIGDKPENGDAQPATTTAKPASIFGMPPGSSAMPGIVTPALGSAGTPVRRPSDRD